MLTKLVLQNFRCFEDHSLPLRPVTVAVGRNNAGKSSLIEALRLVAVVAGRYANLNFQNAPAWLEGDGHLRGVSPSLDNLEINFDTIFHRYGTPPASVSATFDTGASVIIYIGPDRSTHAVIRDANGRVVLNGRQAHESPLPPVAILPQVAPLARRERVLKRGYVRGAMSSALAPLHFRNQLNLMYEKFGVFKELAEETWPRLQIQELLGQGGLTESELHLTVRDDDFVVEIASMGHGLQIWLQTMWFVARTPPESTVILDEPDVYLHADLQRKLIRLLRRRFRQVIVATHSIEIMSEMAPDEILVVDRKRRASKFATSLPAVRRIAASIGGAHNIDLIRLWNAQRVLFVEGKDVAILKRLYDTLFPEAQEPLDSLPNVPTGGWDGWSVVEAAGRLSNNAMGERMRVYAIFDRDYNTNEEVEERMARAAKRKVDIHIWQKKEIENYLIVPTAIQRVIASSLKPGRTAVGVEAIEAEIKRVVADSHDRILARMGQEFLTRDKAGGFAEALRKAQEVLDERWATPAGRTATVSGKWLLSRISNWAQQLCGVSFGANSIASQLTYDEIDPEVRMVLQAVHKTEPFEPPQQA